LIVLTLFVSLRKRGAGQCRMKRMRKGKVRRKIMKSKYGRGVCSPHASTADLPLIHLRGDEVRAPEV
jgi:hypothetical protein